WPGGELRCCESEWTSMAHAGDVVGCAKDRSFRQSDENEAVDVCTNRNDCFVAQPLRGRADEPVGDGVALFGNRRTVPIREKKGQQCKCQGHQSADCFAAETSCPLNQVRDSAFPKSSLAASA